MITTWVANKMKVLNMTNHPRQRENVEWIDCIRMSRDCDFACFVDCNWSFLRMNKWDKRFMELADHISSWSYDPNTKVGCVIVDDRNRILSVGYNGFPRGVIDAPYRYQDRPTKHLFVAHAERNALDNSPHIS